MKQLLTLILLTLSLLAGDVRLKSYPQAQEWEKTAESNADSAYNLALIYHTNIKDNKEAIRLYKLSYQLQKSADVANNLGALYESIKDYDNAVKWYKLASEQNHTKSMINLALLYKKLHQYDEAIIYFKKAYEMGNISGAHGLGYLYFHTLSENTKAEMWFKKAIEKNYIKSYGSLASLYYKENKKVLATAYMIALIDNGYSKSKVLTYVKNNRKVDQETINKAYKLQQTLDIPKHYTGGVN